ncbi:MAG TPA: alpha/beta hydrolase [Acidobacteriaceae bacterium]|jgi:pimeloyl-ACP methyl ester carboxylesterase
MRDFALGMKAQPQRRDIQVSGVRLSYLEWGAPIAGRPSMLMLHGLVAAAETFDRLVEHLAERHVVALDLPGNGLSERRADIDASFEALSELVKQFAAAIKLERPILLGHSHGGALALEIAVADPDWPHALVLLCPAHPFSRREDRLVSFYLSAPGRLFAYMLPRLPNWAHLIAFRRMPGNRAHLVSEDIEPYIRTMRTPGSVAHILRLLGTWNHDMAALKGRLEQAPLMTPAVLLWGDRDMIVPLESAARLLPHLGAAELISMKGVGHLPNEETPEECAKLIDTWLEWRDSHPKYLHPREWIAADRHVLSKT